MESDFDSRRADGAGREDRIRARIRARLALEAKISRHLTLGLGLRTGSSRSQQSPHVTVADFDGNPTGDQELLPDRWFLRWSGERSWIWAGRNAFPFWKPSEQFWDDDVRPAGLAAGSRRSVGPLEVALSAAALTLPDGAYGFHGRLAGGQVSLSGGRGTFPWRAATSFHRIEGDPGAQFLRHGNGARDYALWISAFEVVRDLRARPLALSLEWAENLEEYDASDPDPFTAAHADQTRGFALSARWGETTAPGRWLVGYTFARVEALAVHSSYAQDDWVRWGSSSQTDSSDYRGHEVRFAVALPGDLDLVARFFSAEALTSPQDGKRLRVDLNYRF